jgi:hypothetical protein
MTPGNDLCDKFDTWHKCDTHDMCPTVSHCDEMNPNSEKAKKYKLFRNEKYVIHCDTKQKFGTSWTPKVMKFIGPSNDGRRHGRGTYLFLLQMYRPLTPATQPKSMYDVARIELVQFMQNNQNLNVKQQKKQQIILAWCGVATVSQTINRL